MGVVYWATFAVAAVVAVITCRLLVLEERRVRRERRRRDLVRAIRKERQNDRS